MRYVIAIVIVALCLLDVVVNKSRVTGPFTREINRVSHEIAQRY